MELKLKASFWTKVNIEQNITILMGLPSQHGFTEIFLSFLGGQ